jgi:uncharacterized LabA/DUF88 family protein
MDRFAVFVDAGYFFAAGSQAIRGTSSPRRDISIKDIPALITALADQASRQCEIPSLLRIYWYDAIQGPRMSLEQTGLAHQVGLKLRLGSLNNAGEQKGVDSLIVTDLIELARNNAIADGVLVSGDEDLRVAVQVAQTFGVRVHVLAVGDASRNVSVALQMEADSVAALDKSWLESHLEVSTREAPQVLPQPAQRRTESASGSASVEEVADGVADTLLDNLEQQELTALHAHFAGGNQTVPPEYDRKLIAMTANRLDRRLDSSEMRRIRGVFVNNVRNRASQTGRTAGTS